MIHVRKIAALCCMATLGFALGGATPRVAAAARTTDHFVALFSHNCYIDWGTSVTQGSNREEEAMYGAAFAAAFPYCVGSFVDARPVQALRRQGISPCGIDTSCFI